MLKKILEYIDIRYDDNADISIALAATIADSNANIHVDEKLESANVTHDDNADIPIALVATIVDAHIPPIDLDIVIFRNVNTNSSD